MKAAFLISTVLLALIRPTVSVDTLPAPLIPYQLCDRNAVYTHVKQLYHKHVYTSRGYLHMEEMMPLFLNLTTLLMKRNTSYFRVLEQGCGSGRFLLEAQSRFPMIHFFGTNFEGYVGYGQTTESIPELLRVASTFRVKVMCYPDGRPILPQIRLTPSIANTDFEYPFPTNFFDIITSRDALNSMKIEYNESHIYIPKMLNALKPGRIAIVHADYGANLIWPQIAEKNFTVIGIFNTPKTDKYDSISFVLYKKNDNKRVWTRTKLSFYYSYVGIVFKRCTDKSPRSRYGDCILSKNYVVPYPEDLTIYRTKTSRKPLPDRPEVSEVRIKYAFYYFENLFQILAKWQQTGIEEKARGYPCRPDNPSDPAPAWCFKT